MATKSKTLPIGLAFAPLIAGAVGQEVIAFALEFRNSTAAQRLVTVRHFVQTEGVAYETPIPVPANGKEAWPKVALQPGDYIELMADAAGVNVLVSYDVDDGSFPVAAGLVPRGAWTNAASYDVNDYVSHLGRSWYAIQPNSNEEPGASPTNWAILVEVDSAIVQAAVDAAVADLVAGAPGALDTLNELAAALGDDPDFATTVATSIATRAAAATTITGGGLVSGGGTLEANRVLTVSPASLAQVRAGQAPNVVLTPENSDDALAWVPVADAATVAWDLEAAPNGKVTFTAARTIGAPTNAKVGKIYSLWIEWGAYPPAFNTAFDFGNTGAGTIATGAGKFGILDAQCLSTAPLKFRANLWKSS